MLVDDQPVQNLIMSKFIGLKLPDVEVLEFTNPEEAFAALNDQSPDLIFLDLNMPEMSGWEFLDAMQKKNLRHTVAILTSSTSPADTERSQDYGNVMDFYIKPLDPNELARIGEKLAEYKVA